MVALRPTPRLKNDPDRFVRRVRNDRYQARPYCADEKQRYNLGLYPSREAAQAAVRGFLALPTPDRPKFARPKFVRPVYLADGTTKYHAVVRAGRYRDDLGYFPTAALAAAAARSFIARTYGPTAPRLLACG